MLARLTAFVVWALVAATAVFWGLRMFVRPQPAPAYAVAVGDSVAMRGDLSRLLERERRLLGAVAPGVRRRPPPASGRTRSRCVRMKAPSSRRWSVSSMAAFIPG